MQVDVNDANLAGRRILLVEDEVILAIDISMELEDAGAEVVQVHTLRDAIAASMADASYCSAVLDVNLKGQEVFPAAKMLQERAIPLVFHSGHGKADEILKEYPEALFLQKPSAVGQIATTVAKAISAARSKADGEHCPA